MTRTIHQWTVCLAGAFVTWLPRCSVRAPRRSGFTLFETVLVLAIIVVLAAIAYPSIEAMYGDQKVVAAADGIRASWAEAKSLAMNEGRPYRFEVMWYTSKYRIRPDTGDNAAPTNMEGGRTDQGIVHEEDAPKGVRFTPADAAPANGGDVGPQTASADSGSWVTVATFLPDGTAREDEAAVTLTARGAKARVVRLRGLTGIVTVKDANAEKGQP